jgi:hypothetical protein
MKKSIHSSQMPARQDTSVHIHHVIVPNKGGMAKSMAGLFFHNALWANGLLRCFRRTCRSRRKKNRNL